MFDPINGLLILIVTGGLVFFAKKSRGEKAAKKGPQRPPKTSGKQPDEIEKKMKQKLAQA